MILSMTGFAAVAAELPGVALAVELRSVNHRYLDLQIRLPDELRGARSRRCASGFVARTEARQGRMPRLAQPRRPPAPSSLAVDRARVGRARAGRRRRAEERARARGRCRSARSCAGRACSPSRPSRPRSSRRTRARLVDAGARRARRASRAREGAKLAAMLVERCDAIEAQVARVAPRIPGASRPPTSKSSRARLREAGLDPDRRPPEAGARALRDQGRRRRGALAARRRTSPRCGACSRRAAAPASGSTS